MRGADTAVRSLQSSTVKAMPPRKPRDPEPAAETAAPPVAVAERDLTYTSSDNLALFARDYGDLLSPWLPVVCLPGLSRSNRDFRALALALAGHRHRPRRVLAFDYRGRGRSAWDRDRRNYNPAREMADITDGMAAAGIARAIIVGTSRGGIIGMMMGLMRPATVAGLVLNDVGPAIEPLGLARIKAYIGRTPAPDDWADAARIQRRLHGGAFTAWDDGDWDRFARLTYREEDGGPVSDYDPALGAAFEGVELDQPMQTLWPEFDGLKAIPMMVIRGANSDLLSADTVARMAAAHPGLDVVTVANEGHPPLLRGGPLLGRISSFITGIEGPNPPAGAIVPREAPEFRLDPPGA